MGREGVGSREGFSSRVALHNRLPMRMVQVAARRWSGAVVAPATRTCSLGKYRAVIVVFSRLCRTICSCSAHIASTHIRVVLV